MDPYRITPSFNCFLSMDDPAPTPLASTHCRLAVRDAVWRNSPSVASTGPIFRRSEIVTFVTTASRCNGRWRCSIKLCRNDRICNRIQLLAVIYTGVGVGGGVSPSLASASSYSAIFRLKTSFSAAVIFRYAAAATSTVAAAATSDCYPISFPIWLPQRCSRWTKNGGGDKKRRAHKCINSLVSRKLSHDR